MPGAALAAGVLGLVGALPPAFLAVVVVALGGLSGDTGPDPWTYLLLLAPVLQVWAAVWLLARRGWLPLVLGCLPVGAFTGAGVWTAARADAGGAGWPLLLLLFPVLGAALALTPRVRGWVAARPRGR